VIGTLAAVGWAVTFDTSERAWAGGALPRPLFAVPYVTAHCINGQCTNFVLFDVAL